MKNIYKFGFKVPYFVVLIITAIITITPTEAYSIDQILARCCNEGEELARTGKDCSNFNATKSFVSRELISVCFFSSEICCSKELRIEQCKLGVQVAREGLDCRQQSLHSNLDGGSSSSSSSSGSGGGGGGDGSASGSGIGNIGTETDFFLNCCEACKIGLFIGTSNNEDDCTLEPFSYGLPFDDSFNYCCTDVKTSGSFYLTERDEKDICSKFDRLCSQICENTDDSYVCRCEKGYQLLEDKITCVPIKNMTENNEVLSSLTATVNGDGINNRAGKGSGSSSLPSVSQATNNEECLVGYTNDHISNFCIDINECETGEAECNTDKQICFNTPGSYKCLNILPALQSPCPKGFRQNLKTEQCDDINECLEQLDNCNSQTQTCFNTRGSFLCQDNISEKCLHGFKFDNNQKICQDIDECQELGPCGPGLECFNTQGGYDCKPIKKFDTSKIIKNPLSGSGSTATSKKIICTPGFKQYLNSCIDIDECAVDRFACDSNQICANLPGAFQCICKTGFTLDKVTNACVDVNECQINNHDCLETQRCDNTIGSYTCIRLQSCGTGYTLNAGTGNCDDDDECDLGSHNCIPPYECRNTKGSFRCEKPRYHTMIPSAMTTTPLPSSYGSLSSSSSSPTSPSTRGQSTSTTYTLIPRYSSPVPSQPPYRTPYSHQQYTYPYQIIPSPSPNSRNNEYDQHLGTCGVGFERNTQGACADIDECYISNPCRSNQRCVNTNGSYRCQNLLTCSGGYTSNDDGTQCIDIDECETNEANCGPDQICRNKLGGYTCSCPVGHLLNADKRCEDINECEFYKDQVCPINTECINTIGSYRCECKSGFKKQRDEDKVCIDIDECQEIIGLCAQRCINYWGSYRCACDSGYRLSENNRSCEDIDECEVHKSYNLCMGICDNTPGSYRCACPNGYNLGADERSCKDIDECTTTQTCRGYNEICTNTRGSYRCNKINCPTGFMIDPDKPNRCKRISIMCDRDDIVCRTKPTSYTYNFITLVSNLSIPPQGRGLFSLKGPSFYENVDFDLHIVNIQGPDHIQKATDHYFSMHKMHNEVLLSLMRGLDGPQDIELELSMTVFMSGQPSGSNIAKIFIYVSEFPY